MRTVYTALNCALTDLVLNQGEAARARVWPRGILCGPIPGSEEQIYPLPLCVCVKLVKLDTCLCGVDGWDGGGKEHKYLIIQIPLYQNVTNRYFYSFYVYGRS